MAESILVRYEGGIGDNLCSNRFLFALREKYPDANFKIVFDTNGNTHNEEVMKKVWPDVYVDTLTLGKRKSEQYIADTIFGKTNYPAHIDNAPDALKELIGKSDKFYDLHIDALKWLRYDFDWLRYFYFFPRPTKAPCDISKYNLPENFVLMHLYAGKEKSHNLNQEYAKSLINTIAEIHPVVVITTERDSWFYNGCNCTVITPEFHEIFDIADKCKLYIGCDSGVRYVPLHCSKPTFVFSETFTRYGFSNPCWEIRWLIFTRNVLPMNCKEETIKSVVENIYANEACYLYPTIPSNQVDRLVVNFFNGVGK